jgi:hypothetical protein
LKPGQTKPVYEPNLPFDLIIKHGLPKTKPRERGSFGVGDDPRRQKHDEQIKRSLVAFLTFSHPDYTVGPGVSPDRAQ